MENFLHAILYCQYNCQHILYCLNVSLNNKVLREIDYLYDKIKQNIIHTEKATVKMVSSHSFPKRWTDLEWHQQSEQCIKDHENIHIFITHDSATLLLELSPKEITQHKRNTI